MAWDSELSFEQEIRLEGFLRESGGKFLEVVSGYGVFSGILLAEYDILRGASIMARDSRVDLSWS